MTDIERFRNLKARYEGFLKECVKRDIPLDLTHFRDEMQEALDKVYDLENPDEIRRLQENFNREKPEKKEDVSSTAAFIRETYGPLFLIRSSFPSSREDAHERAEKFLDAFESVVVYNETHIEKFYEDAVGRIRGSRNLSPGDDSKKDAADRNVLSIAANPPP